MPTLRSQPSFIDASRRVQHHVAEGETIHARSDVENSLDRDAIEEVRRSLEDAGYVNFQYPCVQSG